MPTIFRQIDLKEETTWKTWVKWEYNIKINIKLMESDNVESTALANDRDKWWSVEPVRIYFPAKQPCTNDTVCNAAMQHCTQYHLYSDWLNGIEILQGSWQHGEKVEYCYPSGLENTLCKWDIYVPLVTKGLKVGLFSYTKKVL